MSDFSDEVLYSKGVEYYKQNQFDNSLYFLSKIKNKNLNTLKLIAQIYIKKNDTKKTRIFLEKMLILDKNNIFALNCLGDVNKLEKKYTEAEKFYQESISYDEKFVPALFNLASLYEDKGELELAKKYYLRVLKINDKNYTAYFNLQRLDENLITAKIIKKIDDELKLNKISNDKNIAYGHFVLAKNYRRKKEINKEISELSKGHKIFFNSDPLNKDAADYWLKTIPKMLNKNILFKNNDKNRLSDIEPILIFGIPRTGTTLVETIITSGDEKIYNAGENFIVQKALQNSQINEKIYEIEKSIIVDVSFLRKDIISSYKRLLYIKPEKFKLIDRTMTNFFFSEIFLKLFPNTKIINCKRDSFHNLIAIYQQCLNNLPWAHSIENIKEYISIYNSKLKRLEKYYKKNILNVDLKRLTEFPEDTSKEIMSFCKLNWSKKVLEYYDRKDLICTTASNIQIRKKIFKYDSDKFLPYKEYFDNC